MIVKSFNQKILARMSAVGIASVLAICSFSNMVTAVSIDSLSESRGSINGGNEILLKGSDFLNYQEDKITKVVAGQDSMVAITQMGNAFAWGNNDKGQLGTHDTDKRIAPTNISNNFNGEKITDIFAGEKTYAAKTESGSIYMWGDNEYWQFGSTGEGYYAIAQNVTGIFKGEDIIDIKLANSHTVALASSGKVFTWGSNQYGQLGTDSFVDSISPAILSNSFAGESISSIGVRDTLSMAVTNTGKMFVWGSPTYLTQVGSGPFDKIKSPTNITDKFFGEQIDKISSGGVSYTIVKTKTGKIYGWGDNYYSQIGTDQDDSFFVPFDITNIIPGENMSGVLTALGGFHTLAITDTGKVYSWGLNSNGQVGGGCSSYVCVSPQDLTAYLDGKNITSIGAGSYTSFALTDAGELYVWGNGLDYPIGTGSSQNYNLPQNITDNFDLIKVSTSEIESIYFGNSRVSNFEIIDGNTIKIVIPAHAAGVVDVRVISIKGNEFILPAAYEYVEESGNIIIPSVPNTGAL